MRDWWLVGVATATIATAYVADRIREVADANAWTYAEPGARQLLLAADRIPKLVILAALLWVGVRLVRSRARSAVAWTLVVIGVAVGVAPALVQTMIFVPMPRIVLDLVLPSQFVPWAGAGILVLGIIGVTVGRLPSARRGGWIAAGAAIALVAASWPADAWMRAAFDAVAGIPNADAIRLMIIGELVARLGSMAALAAVAWLVLTAARATLPAVTTLVVGLVVFIGFAFVAVFVLPSPPWPAGTDAVPVTGWVGRWVAGGLVILGTCWAVRSLIGERVPADEVPPTVVGSDAA